MRIDIPEQKKLTYEMTIPIRWGDMDAMGHATTVWIDFPAKQSLPLPASPRAAIE